MQGTEGDIVDMSFTQIMIGIYVVISLIVITAVTLEALGLGIYKLIALPVIGGGSYYLLYIIAKRKSDV